MVIAQTAMPTNVVLHVYDVSTDSNIQKVNQYLTAVGTGAFHGGLEVYGTEWSYGFAEKGTGVFSNPPKGCTAHHYRESHHIAQINKSESEVKEIIEKMKTEWPGSEYDLLRHNCVIFSDALSRAVGAGPLPAWVTSLAGAGATVCDGAIMAVNQAQAAAIIAAAKAGQIDEKYNVRGTAQVKAAEFVSAMNDVNKKYKIQENAADLAGKAATKGGQLANEAATKAQELDDKYHIRDQAASMAGQAGEQLTSIFGQATAKAQEMNNQYQIGAKAQGLADKAAEQAKGLATKAQTSASPEVAVPGPSIEGNPPKTPVCFCC